MPVRRIERTRIHGTRRNTGDNGPRGAVWLGTGARTSERQSA